MVSQVNATTHISLTFSKMAFNTLLQHLLVLVALLPTFSFARTWPNPQLDELDSQRYDRTGYKARGFAPGVIPCTDTLSGSDSGRANAADWIRTVSDQDLLYFHVMLTISCCLIMGQAYHDMATHNVEDGTGGLDASIRFETDRAEVRKATHRLSNRC